MIGLNDGARRRFQLDDYQYCILYFDPESKRVGIELTNDKDVEGAQKIRFRKTGSDVAGRSFLSFFGIEGLETATYPLSKDEGTGYLIIDMTKGRVRSSSSKNAERP
jgi:hypothetical protein